MFTDYGIDHIYCICLHACGNGTETVGSWGLCAVGAVGRTDGPSGRKDGRVDGNIMLRRATDCDMEAVSHRRPSVQSRSLAQSRSLTISLNCTNLSFLSAARRRRREIGKYEKARPPRLHGVIRWACQPDRMSWLPYDVDSYHYASLRDTK